MAPMAGLVPITMRSAALVVALATGTHIAGNGVAVDTAGNIVVGDSDGSHVWVFAATSGTFYGRVMVAGRVYVIAGGGNFNAPISGVPATSTFVAPLGLALDAAGNVIMADLAYNRLRVVAVASGRFYGQLMQAGDIYTIAGGGTGGLGDGGPASKSAFTAATGVAVEKSGAILVADTDRIRLIST
jgi:hypothetical protein